MSEEVKNETAAPQTPAADENAAQAAAAETPQPETAPANEPPKEEPKKEEPKKEESKELDIEEKRRCANERARAIVKEALKPEGPPDPLEPFFALCAHGTVEEVREAIAAGADVNARNHAGSTPLHRAVTNNSFDVIKCLVDAGADVNARSEGRFHDTVLHSAIWTKDPRVIQLLLEHGAQPYAYNVDNWTPLHLAAYHTRGPEILGQLVQSMNPTAAAPAKRYKGTIEFVDSWNRRAYQMVDGAIVEHNLRRVGPGIFLGHLVIVQYHASTKSKASVENLTLKAEEEAKANSAQRRPKTQ